MKLRSTLLCALAAIMTISCQEPLPTNQVDPTENKGYFHLSDLSVELVADQKENSNEVTRVATRNDEEFLATFDCYVYDENGQNVIKQFKYGDRPEGDIELEAGKYIFKMISSEIAPAAFEQPVYGVTEVFTIVRKQTTELKNLVCTLQNIQASISYDAPLRAALSDDTVATLSVGEAALEFVMDETRSGYFKAVNPLNNIDVALKGKYTPEGKTTASEFEFTTTIKDVKAGQWSKIFLFIQESGEGNISISVTIDGWVVDESTVFDLSQLITEDTLVDDTDKPVISIVDGDIDNPVVLAAADFDENGNYLKSLVVDVTTKSAIASLLVDITSTNSEMIASLSAYNLSESFDLCNMSKNAEIILRNMLKLPCNAQVLGQQSASFNLTGVMPLLMEYVGTHSFQATVTDEKGGKTVKTLTITVEGEQAGPSIVWKGYNIDQRYEISSDLVVEIIVTAPSGVKDFVVTIKSTHNDLQPSSLTNLGLCDVMNLVTPTASYSSTNPNFDSSNMGTQIANLGFPIEDNVKNQTSVPLQISSTFLSLLSGLTGGHDFEMTVTDNEGNTTVKSLMLKSL